MDNPAQGTALTNRGWTGDTAVGQTRLDEAWRALRREVPSLEASLDAGDVTTADVVDVVAAAALRVLRNPEGYQQASAGIDNYNESFTRADATQDLYFTAAELRRLQPADGISADSGWSGSIAYS